MVLDLSQRRPHRTPNEAPATPAFLFCPHRKRKPQVKRLGLCDVRLFLLCLAAPPFALHASRETGALTFPAAVVGLDHLAADQP